MSFAAQGEIKWLVPVQKIEFGLDLKALFVSFLIREKRNTRPAGGLPGKKEAAQ